MMRADLMRYACCLVFILLLGTVGCSTAPPTDAPHVTLYAIQPALHGYNPGDGIETPTDPGHDLANGYFHSYKVLGEVDLTGTDAGTELAGYLEEETDMPQGLIAGCFEPRHGLRVVRDGVTTDYVLCFACKQFDWHAGGDLAWAGKQTLDHAWYDRFTRPLNDAGIELAD